MQPLPLVETLGTEDPDSTSTGPRPRHSNQPLLSLPMEASDSPGRPVLRWRRCLPRRVWLLIALVVCSLLSIAYTVSKVCCPCHGQACKLSEFGKKEKERFLLEAGSEYGYNGTIDTLREDNFPYLLGAGVSFN